MPASDLPALKRTRAVYLAASTCALLFLGLIYAFSMFAAPLCATFGLEKADVALTFNIAMIVTSCGTVVGSQFDMRLGLRPALIATGVLSLVGFGGTALFGNGNLLVVYVFYGGLGGLAAGMGNNIIVSATNVWFPDKVGFSSGVLMMGFSFGALILGTLAVNLMPVFGLPAVFMAIGVSTCIVVVALALIISRPPSSIMHVFAPEKVNASGHEPGERDRALASPVFYTYWVWAIIIFAIGLATIGNCASDAQSVGIDVAFATLLVGLVSACNGIARIVFGLVYDKTNVKVTMVLDACCALVATLCIVGAFFCQVPVLYVVGALCCGFCYGGVPVVASAFTRQRFGAKNYPLNLALANLAIMFGSILNIVLQGATGADGRPVLFCVLAVFALVAVADVLPFSKLWNRDIRRQKQEEAAGAPAVSESEDALA